MRAPEFTVGVEEEFHVVLPHAGRATNDGELVLEELPDPGDHYTGELLQSMVETSTSVCGDLGQVRRELERTRRSVVEAAHAADRRVVAAGTLPTRVLNPQIAPGDRYARILELHQQVALEQSVCGCHVHVGISDREAAVAVANRVTPWLPVLLALTVNSPFHSGSDTGFASYRTVVWSRWPSAGPWPGFADHDGYERLITTLLSTHVITDRGQVYWDMRLSDENPTLEFRTADTCLSIDETVLHAALCRALARTAWRELVEGRPAPVIDPVLQRAARWKAARFGLDEELLDVVATQARSARAVVDRLLTHVEQALRTDHDHDEAHRLVDRVFRHGSGAERQRRVVRAGGGLDDVVALLADETAAGLSDPTTPPSTTSNPTTSTPAGTPAGSAAAEPA